MKFSVTEYAGTKEILKFPDSYVAMSVMVDDTGIEANSDGKKIVPKGTIVGGATASVLADKTQKVQEKITPSTKASLDIGAALSLNYITYRAVETGTKAHGIKIAHIDPAAQNKALEVKVEGDTINIYLATENAETKAIISTVADVIAAVNAHLVAKQLVVASVKLGSEFDNVVSAAAAAPLAGGTDGNASAAEGVLLNDVDVTDGPAAGAMILSGYIARGKIPKSPVAETIAALPLIKFIV